VQHGFAIGQMELPAVDVMPGQMSEMTVTFDRPGKYVFYCTHWCSPGHWRMRGTIEVLAANPQGEGFADTNPPPLYVQLGLDIDAPHAAAVSPTARPSAARGAALGVSIPAEYQTSSYYRSHSPAQLWQALRALPVTAQLSDAEVWDLVANAWETNTTAQALATGKQLFTANCAACHGERGAGDGPMAFALSGQSTGALTPTNFTNATMMFGASPALLQGKISRGGMGTGMPYWGPIFNDVQVRAIVDFLWTFQMDYQAKP
jgi:mono/diheme cytochrome c family protein